MCKAQKRLSKCPQAEGGSRDPACPRLHSYGDRSGGNWPRVCSCPHKCADSSVAHGSRRTRVLPDSPRCRGQHLIPCCMPGRAWKVLMREAASTWATCSTRWLPTCTHLMKNSIKSKSAFFGDKTRVTQNEKALTQAS